MKQLRQKSVRYDAQGQRAYTPGGKFFWLVVGFVYIVSPVDIIPGDLLLFPLGIVDDAGMLAWVVSVLKSPTIRGGSRRRVTGDYTEPIRFGEDQYELTRHVRRASNGRAGGVAGDMGASRTRFASRR